MSKYKERIALGLCGMCGKDKENNNKNNCNSCLKKAAKSAKKRQARLCSEGLCIYCGRTKTNPGKSCLTCQQTKKKNRIKKDPTKETLKKTSTRWLGTQSRWRELEELFNQQNETCKYSGLPITIRDTAQIDHKVPRSCQGTSEISNLQWVHCLINRMKSNMPEDVFVYLCKMVAKNTPDMQTPII